MKVQTKTKKKTAKEILLEAAKIVEAGWCQGVYHDLGHSRHCALGAIRQASGVRDPGFMCGKTAESREARKACNRLKQAIGRKGADWFGIITDWNDNIERQQEDVVKAMRKAARMVKA